MPDAIGKQDSVSTGSRPPERVMPPSGDKKVPRPFLLTQAPAGRTVPTQR